MTFSLHYGWNTRSTSRILLQSIWAPHNDYDASLVFQKARVE